MTTHLLDTIDPVVLGANLAAARKARGLTQQQAAGELGIARTTVVAMEKGERRPRPVELVRLADLYGRKVGDLVRQAPAEPTDSFIVQFRSARASSGTPASEQREIDIRVFKELCDRYLELEEMTRAPLPRRYPNQYDIGGADPKRAAEEVASSERNRLGLGDGPIGDLWGLLETDVGLRVFAPPFQDRNLAGLFAYTDAHGGCIAVNGKHPEDRRRWTATHEYGHFLTDRYRAEITVLPSYRRVPESERFADAFTRHFLMPGPGLVRRFQAMKRAKGGPITPADLLHLCQLYRVSFQALTLRLEELKLLPVGTWDRLRDAGFKPHAARDLLDLPAAERELSRLPYRFEALAVQAYTNGQLSEGRLAHILGVDRLEARRLVEELQGTQFYEDGEVRQLALDLGTNLVGARA